MAYSSPYFLSAYIWLEVLEGFTSSGLCGLNQIERLRERQTSPGLLQSQSWKFEMPCFRRNVIAIELNRVEESEMVDSIELMDGRVRKEKQDMTQRFINLHRTTIDNSEAFNRLIFESSGHQRCAVHGL